MQNSIVREKFSVFRTAAHAELQSISINTPLKVILESLGRCVLYFIQNLLDVIASFIPPDYSDYIPKSHESRKYITGSSIVSVPVGSGLEKLSEKQLGYLYNISRAVSEGQLIAIAQNSIEAPLIFVFLIRLMKHVPFPSLKKLLVHQLWYTESEVNSLIDYIIGFFACQGNHRAGCGIKFIPNVSKEKMRDLMFLVTPAEEQIHFETHALDPMYSLDTGSAKEERIRGPSMFFSSNCNMQDVNVVDQFLKSREMHLANTMVLKTTVSAKAEYEIHISSIDEAPQGDETFTFAHGDADFKIKRGNHSRLLGRVTKYLKEAANFTSSKYIKDMIAKNVMSFQSGNIADHTAGAKDWMKLDLGATNWHIGFIDTTKDPSPMHERALFSGFSATVNLDKSKDLGKLVTDIKTVVNAELPWPKELRRTERIPPTVQAVDVISSCGNITKFAFRLPIYPDICQRYGCMHSVLDNIENLEKLKVPSFCSMSYAQQQIFEKYAHKATDIHNILYIAVDGINCKLISEDAEGNLNIDVSTLSDPITAKQVTNWYKHDETPESVFGEDLIIIEECRRLGLIMYAVLLSEVSSKFCVESSTELTFAIWVSSFFQFMTSLPDFDFGSKTWRDPTSKAKCILWTMLMKKLPGLATFTFFNDNSSVKITFNQECITARGQDAIRGFLKELQFYKSTANRLSITKLFSQHTAIDNLNDRLSTTLLKLRKLCLVFSQPPTMMIQPRLVKRDNKFIVRDYPNTIAGLFESIIDRWEDLDEIWDIFKELHSKHCHNFS